MIWESYTYVPEQEQERHCWRSCRKQYTHTRFRMVPSVWRTGQFLEVRGRSIRVEEDHQWFTSWTNFGFLQEGPPLRFEACWPKLQNWSIHSIVHDGWRTGPRGTPSALNTSFEWVLFGKIDGRTDVVDVASHTLEQLVDTDETSSKHYYADVLTTGKKRDFHRTSLP